MGWGSKGSSIQQIQALELTFLNAMAYFDWNELAFEEWKLMPKLVGAIDCSDISGQVCRMLGILVRLGNYRRYFPVIKLCSESETAVK